ncbi:hypothetical protein LINPERPRIM_LOCUS29311, partial [Linum perenne]
LRLRLRLPSQQPTLPRSQVLPLLQLPPPGRGIRLHLPHNITPHDPFPLWILPSPPPRPHNHRGSLRMRDHFIREIRMVLSTHGGAGVDGDIPGVVSMLIFTRTGDFLAKNRHYCS